jgi:cytochrome c-type biogenesis protein CcmE
VDFMMSFLQERWYIIVAIILVLFIVMRIVKTVVKWAIVAALLAGLYFYGASYKDQLMNIGTVVSTEAKNQAVKAFSSEMKDAQYKQNADGTYTVTTKSLRLDGKPGSNEVKVTFMNQTFTMKVDDIVNAFIEQAKKNTKV